MGLFSKDVSIDINLIKTDMMHRVAYIGLERCDLIVALANVAVTAGLKVAIADNSVTHDLFNIYYNDEGDDEAVVDRGNLCIIKNAVLDDDNHGYDLVIEYLGANEPIDTDAEALFLMADSQRANIRAVREYMSADYQKRMLIYRDQASDFTLNDMAHFIGIDKPNQISAIKYDRKEAEAYAKLTRQPRTKFTLSFSVSEKLFESMCRVVFGDKLTDKQLLALIKKGVSLAL